MRGGVVGGTETGAGRPARMRLRKVAGGWSPTIPADVLDQIVAAAWIEGREANGGSGERTAVVAAAAVRRHGLRALRGDGVDLPEDAEKRIAALTADESDAEPRAQRFRRRARPEALGRRAPDDPVVVDEPGDTPAPTVRNLQRDDGEDDGPPTRRRRGTRDEIRPAGERRQADDAERPRSLRILAETVQIITGRRAEDDQEIVEVVADEAPATPTAPKAASPTATAATSPAAPARPAAPPAPARADAPPTAAAPAAAK